LNKPRRIFLKVLATGPLVGCAGADPVSSPQDGLGGRDNSPSGSAGGVGSAGTPVAGSGGSSAASGSSATGTAGNPFSNSGNQGGFSFANGGSSTGTAGTNSGVAGAASAGASGSNNSLTPLVNVSSVPIGGLVIAASIFFVGRDTKGIYVMSMQCTHKGCAVVFISGNKLDCPCHHSVFDFNGNVLVGPATTQLPHYAAFVDASGNISVDRYAVVSGSARVAV
jgi:Rieske Fe-S protein